jgi:hypothetical protein
MRLLRFALYSALLLAPPILFAQSKEGNLVANIPFAFVVGGQTLQPGHYVVSNLHDHLSIQGQQSAKVLAPVHSKERPPRENSSKLVFHRYGDTYFLSEVWIVGNPIGKELFPSRAEHKMQESGREREIAVLQIESIGKGSCLRAVKMSRCRL